MNNLWVWGYVAKEIPAALPFVNRPAYCSLETGADYLGADNVMFLNPLHDMETLNDELFQYVTRFDNVLCGLTHEKYEECAEKVSRFSLKHPNIKGALIDDFLSITGPSAHMTVAETKAVYDALKCANPALKLYVVRYETQDQRDLIPYLDYIDVVNYWIWVSTEHRWKADYTEEIYKIRFQLKNKPILQGIFLHHYGDDNNAMPLELLKLQVPKIASLIRSGVLDGWAVLQNGWFSSDAHREQLQFLKQYFEWFYGTMTRSDAK